MPGRWRPKAAARAGGRGYTPGALEGLIEAENIVHKKFDWCACFGCRRPTRAGNPTLHSESTLGNDMQFTRGCGFGLSTERAGR